MCFIQTRSVIGYCTLQELSYSIAKKKIHMKKFVCDKFVHGAPDQPGCDGCMAQLDDY